METELSPDKEKPVKDIPPVPIKTYQWEDLRRAREAGAYPWTHFLKAPLIGEVTAEDIIRETTPRRSMSREFSKSRTQSPIDKNSQRILNLDSSPGSSRRHGEEGDDEGVHIPNFSKEVSLDSEEDILNKPTTYPYPLGTYLTAPLDVPKNLSPKSILKRRVPEQQYIAATETREKTKCCHPLVNKIKHLADKTLHKLDKNDNEKSPVPKRKKNDESQEIRNLKSSPGAERRQKFSAIKLGDSDEMSKTLNMDTPPPRKKKEHIYEDIEESKVSEEKSIHFSPEIDTCLHKKTDDGSGAGSNKDTESIIEKKSIASQDPSLVIDDDSSLTTEEHVMEKLHILNKIAKDAILLDEEMDPDEPNVDEIFENQLEEREPHNESPNITITEILEGDIEEPGISSSAIPIESSPSPNPNEDNMEFPEREWSKPNSDHEYEIIEKPSTNITYPASIVDEKTTFLKADDEFSSTSSLERKYLQHTSDEDEQIEDKENDPERKSSENILNAEVLQKDIEDRYFVNTPSTISRTECEVSTSQVDSSALENLPLKRSSRSKPSDGIDNKIQQRIKEGTGKLKTQAGKLKSKLQNIKTKQFTMPDKPKISMPDRPKFKMPERPKISFPDRPRFTMPDKRKFSLPDRPKFKKINLSEKLTFGDKKKFTLPERPKFNVPDFPKFKMPEKPKINFPSLGRKKVGNESEATGSGASKTVDFETRTYPRLFNRKKKSEISKTSSSPTLNREDTPPPTFTFTRVKKVTETIKYIPDSPDQPREYGTVDKDKDYENENDERFNTTYDFDKLTTDYMHDESGKINDRHTASISESPSKQEYTHINEINNDEFFVRPRGISRENIQVREYLSDEIRQAFQIPKNVLALMGSNQGVNDDVHYDNEPEADPELMLGDDNENIRYENEDLNDRDDGYYTFPPIRPSRAKRKKKEHETMDYIDDNVNTSIQFSEVDLELQDENAGTQDFHEYDNEENEDFGEPALNDELTPSFELHAIHDYANDGIIEYRRSLPNESQTLPMPPRRRKKDGRKDFNHSSINDFTNLSSQHLNQCEDQPQDKQDDVIVYRTEHEYTVPQVESVVSEQSPVPPRRNRSRSSRGTSLCDDDRTSHGAESLTLDTHITPAENMHLEKEFRHESPGYATVDKGPAPKKSLRRSKSKTPPVRRRKSSSSERKYYTVGPSKPIIPDRPPRKKSSASLMTLDNYTKCDVSQYIEIDEPRMDDLQKDLQSGKVINKMKDRPLPPPPRPPRGPKRKSRGSEGQIMFENEQDFEKESYFGHSQVDSKSEDVLEIEVSTQTDPLPDDVDFELGMEDNFDVSMSSSLRDIVDEESVIMKGQQALAEIPRTSRAASRSEKSLKLSDPKISDLSKASIGRTSPTVILVEKRVSSPTRINECDQILTEASLTVQHIDIDESKIPDVPPLPRATRSISAVQSSKNIVPTNEELAVERVSDANRNIHLDNLVAQRLQVRDLDVSRLNVSELQASKIVVSDIEGMSLQVTELDSKSGHISVSGIEFSQSVIDEIVKKFAEITTNMAPSQHSQHETTDLSRPVSREEHTQTDAPIPQEEKNENKEISGDQHSHPQNIDDNATPPPQRPPPPDLTPLLYSYLQDISLPPAPSYQPRSFRERHFTDFHEQQHQSPAPPTRRIKRKLIAPHTGSSSEEDRPRPSPRRAPVPGRAHEPTITEAGAQFLRVCQNSISRTLRNMFNSLMSYISGTEDKKDVQMALVIFLVLIAGLIMFGLSDSKTIHHHHWEFFNPPDGKQ